MSKRIKGFKGIMLSIVALSLVFTLAGCGNKAVGDASKVVI